MSDIDSSPPPVLSFVLIVLVVSTVVPFATLIVVTIGTLVGIVSIVVVPILAIRK